MPSRRRIVLLASLVLTGCASVPTQPTPPPAQEEESITLRFGWEPGQRAQVSATRSVLGWTPRGPDEMEIALRYVLEVVDEEPLLVRRSQQRVKAMPAIFEPNSVELAAIELGEPDWRISPEGNLVGIEAVAKSQACAASLLARMAKGGEAPASFQGRLSELFSEEGIHRRAGAFWDELVGFWSGGTFEVGRTYHARDRAPVSALGGIGLEMLFELTLQGRVPCEEGEEAADCVLLELVATPEPSQHPRLLAFVTTLFPHPAREIQVEKRLSIVTDPETLRPRRFHARRSVVIPFYPVEGVEPPSFEQVDDRRIHFRWSQDPPPGEPAEDRQPAGEQAAVSARCPAP